MDLIKGVVGVGEEDNESCFPSMSLKDRLIGFAICFGIGTLLQILSMGSFIGILVGKTSKFAILYTLGNIVSITGYNNIIYII